MSTFDAVLAQYEKNKQATSGNANKFNQEDRMKKYFTTVLPKGSKGEERRIRILPTPDGSSPFKEVYFHEIQVDGKWIKLFDPKQEGKRSPLNEVKESLEMTGVQSDKELARQYRSRKFYIVKVIDRDHEADGVKFWRFKHNAKQDGVLDKIFPIFQKKGDVTDPQKGRDLTLFLTLTKSGTGKEYTTINSIIPEDPSSLHEDQSVSDSWVNDELVWSDVYSKKPEEYLDMIAKGEVPRWDSDSKKWVSNSQSEEIITSPKTTIQDPQDDSEVDDDLPF
jgi:lipopolysaccharide export LptBFGC system permease protein LptF